jgi:hypothetical protein
VSVLEIADQLILQEIGLAMQSPIKRSTFDKKILNETDMMKSAVLRGRKTQALNTSREQLSKERSQQ